MNLSLDVLQTVMHIIVPLKIYSKRVMWQNASYVTFTPHGLTD